MSSVAGWLEGVIKARREELSQDLDRRASGAGSFLLRLPVVMIQKTHTHGICAKWI